MMMTVSLPLYLLLIANAALIVAAAFAVMRVERALRESAEFWGSPTGATLKAGDETDDNSRLIALRMAALQRAVDELAAREPAAVPADAAVVDLPVAHAVRMVKEGASTDDLVRVCGLNAGEAELVQRLHGRPALRASANVRQKREPAYERRRPAGDSQANRHLRPDSPPVARSA